MYIDLVLCEKHFTGLGFDRVLKVNLIDFNTQKDLKKKLDAERGLRIVIGSKNNRTAMEAKKLDILLSPEKGIRKDPFHHRSSGLDHVICKLAKNNNTAIGFNFNDILTNQGVLRAERLGRMMQNVKLCRKHRLRMVLGSFAKDEWQMRSKNDLISFGITLGMNPGEAQKALQAVNEIIRERKEKKRFITEGVKLVK